MNDTQEQKRNIDWLKSSQQLALGIWGMATYFGLLAGIAWVSVAVGGNHPTLVAGMAVLLSTWLNWMAFSAIERKSRS